MQTYRTSNNSNPEKTDLEIRFIPIVCSAPLIYAHEHGFFEKNGLKVNLKSSPGWSGIKELLVYDKVDAVHMLSPMPLSCSLGIDGKRADIRLAAVQNINGQALTLAKKHQGIEDVRDMKGFTFGVPYRFSMHYYLLCYYLAANGINPLKDVTIEEVAPPRMPYYIEKERVDGVFAPEPFNQIPVYRGFGFIHVLSKEIWDGHPCCGFATSQSFIDKYPNTYRAMLTSVLQSELALHRATAEQKKAIAREICGPEHLNQDDPVPVEQVLLGEFPDGKGTERIVPDRIDFVPYPWVEYGSWMLSQMQRWGQLKCKVDDREISESVFQSEGTRELAEALGFETKHGPSLDGVAPFTGSNSFSYMSKLPFCSFSEEREPPRSYDLPEKAIERLSQILGKLAEVSGGELDPQIEITSDDEIGRLEQMLGEMILNMKFAQEAIVEQRDYLERHAVELQGSETKYRTLVENLPQKIFLKDTNSVYIRCNKNYAEALGITAAEIAGRDDYEFYPRELADKYRADDRRIMDAGDIEELEEPYVEDGKKFWVHTIKVPVKDAHGDVAGILGIFRDITDRKRTEVQSERAWKFTQTIIDNFPGSLMVINRDHTIAMVNRTVLEMAGGQDPVAARLKCHRVSHKSATPCEGAEHPCPLRRIVATKGPIVVEHIHHDAGGHTSIVEVFASPIFDEEGEVIQIIELCRDITERKKSEEEKDRMQHTLGERYKELNCLYEIGRLFQNPDYQIEDVFLKTAELIPPSWQYPEVTCARIVTGSDEFKTDNFRETNWILSADIVIEGRKIGWVEVCYLEEKPVRDEGPFVKEERELINSIAEQLARAIKRRDLEKHLLQTQKLEAIGGLAAGIAHEINTPVQYVSDNIRFLQESILEISGVFEKYKHFMSSMESGQVAPDVIADMRVSLEEADIDCLMEEMPTAIEQSLEGAERVAHIVRAMKDFSHPSVKEKMEIDINKAIDTTITVACNEWKYVAEMETDFDSELPLVPCLPGEFNQVILNMITNAAYAIGKVVDDGSNGKGIIKISTQYDGECVEIHISDTGTGIPVTVRDKIFDPFFTTKEVGKGSGQGLAISHSVIADKHGGTIDFNTKEGKGTTFIVRLPIESTNN